MEALTNQVSVPLSAIVAQWKKFALPGSFGRVVTFLRVELTEAGEIRLQVRTQFSQQTGKDQVVIPWSAIGAEDSRSERVVEKLHGIRGELFVICHVEQVIGDIRDGFVDRVSLVKVEERRL